MYTRTHCRPSCKVPGRNVGCRPATACPWRLLNKARVALPRNPNTPSGLRHADMTYIHLTAFSFMCRNDRMIVFWCASGQQALCCYCTHFCRHAGSKLRQQVDWEANANQWSLFLCKYSQSNGECLLHAIVWVWKAFLRWDKDGANCWEEKLKEIISHPGSLRRNYIFLLHV